MARLIIFENPLDSSKRRREILPAGVPLLAWLDANSPTPPGCTREVWVNGRLLHEGAPYRTGAADAVIVQMRPGLPAGVTITYLIVQALISTAISFIVSQIFAPSKPKSSNVPAPSQVYGISPPKNTARLGEPIPVIYGSVIVSPDYAAQPYVEYLGNEQYLRALLCLGQGEFDVATMLLGDSDAAALPTDVASFQIFGPAAHASTFGNIQASTGVRENVVTSADVAEQELLAPNQASNNIPSTWYWRATNQYQENGSPPPPAFLPGVVDLSALETPLERINALPPNPALGTTVQACVYQEIREGGENPDTYTRIFVTYVATAYVDGQSVPPYSLVPPPGVSTIGSLKPVGPFETCKAGQRGTSIELDFSFPGGLFDLDSGGDLSSHHVDVRVGVTQIDDAGAALGAEVLYPFGWTATSNTALRFTVKQPVALGRYRVRAYRFNDADARPTTQERCYWTGLKFELAPPPAGTVVYGDVTLAAVVLRASNAISGDAAASVRFRVTRRLPPPPGGPTAPTSNPADAFADIVCARYGGNRPRNGDELDLDALAAARIRWAAHNGFNAVFDQPSTVWEALTLSIQTVSAAPLPVGTRLSLMQDGVQPDRTQIFTDANTGTGTLQITHAFDRDGTPAGERVEYRDPRTFSAAALLDPPGAPDYETISLFGCTDVAVAQQHATLAQNRRRLQRTTIQFVTELEGLSCLPGDRIGVQALMPRWAQVGRVMGFTNTFGYYTLKVDRALEWTDGAAHAIQLRDPTGRPFTVRPVQPGATPFDLVLPSMPFTPVAHGGAMDATVLSFGVDGQEVTDWTVTAMQPQGDTVSIQAVNYDPAVWTGAGAHLVETHPRPEVLL